MTCSNPNCNCNQPHPPPKDMSDVWRQKRADQEWEMAGLARQDGDHKAAAIHTERARAIQRGEA
jgi:hypothetical protein